MFASLNYPEELPALRSRVLELSQDPCWRALVDAAACASKRSSLVASVKDLIAGRVYLLEDDAHSCSYLVECVSKIDNRSALLNDECTFHSALRLYSTPVRAAMPARGTRDCKAAEEAAARVFVTDVQHVVGREEQTHEPGDLYLVAQRPVFRRNLPFVLPDRPVQMFPTDLPSLFSAPM